MILDVRLEAAAVPVGQLAQREDGTIVFRYLPEYLDGALSHALSLALPLREQPFDDDATRAFFDNLLPENDQLRALIEREGIAREDLVAILHRLGADLPGAISCLPAGAPALKVPGLLVRDYVVLPPEEFAEVIVRLERGSPLPPEIRDPSPVAGYQGKIALTVLPDGQPALPRPDSGAPTTHILKVPGVGLPREAFYEVRCAELAHGLGLPVVPTGLGNEVGYEYVLTQRFDRVVDGDRVTRLHQEDFAQALGLPARLKYERKGNARRRFDVPAILSVLDRTIAPAAARAAFLDATIFNLAIGNTDNHAKNHALLYDEGPVPRLAPLYDLVPILLSETYNRLLAFNIGAARDADKVTDDDIWRLLGAFGLTGSAARRFVEERARPLLGRLNQLPPASSVWEARLYDLIAERSARIV